MSKTTISFKNKIREKFKKKYGKKFNEKAFESAWRKGQLESRLLFGETNMEQLYKEGGKNKFLELFYEESSNDPTGKKVTSNRKNYFSTKVKWG